MATKVQVRDALSHLAQAGGMSGIMLVRLTQLESANQYKARPIEFDEEGNTQFVGTDTLTVTNLAEPADSDGTVPENTNAVAVDVEGRWIVFIRPSGAPVFAAKIISSQGNGAYTVREQVATGAGTFSDKQGAASVTAYNLAELSLGPGASVDDETIVLVATLRDTGSPPTLRYVFDHPVYAKYLS
ncbi:MAG: hypothetical protein ACYTF6_00085 [Planctomycetota bacterium]|jgi:hypothetical protein